MKKYIVGFIFLLWTMSPAISADMSSANVTPQSDWTGFYVGGHAGYGWLDIDRSTTGGSYQFDTKGFIGGTHLGYSRQFGSIVVGAETDLEFSNLDGNDGGAGGLVDTMKMRWQGSVRARLGYAFDNLLIYGTGGFAYGDFEGTLASAITDSKNHVGWTAGGGAEYAISEHLTTRIEYRYTDFNSKTYSFEPVGLNAKYKFEMHSVRVGLSYKF